MRPLRVKDVDFGRHQIVVRAGKGDKDRITTLPTVVRAELSRHLETVKQQHDRDLRQGAGWVELPWARETGQRRRHHLHESVVQRAVKDAVRQTGIAKRATCHTLRHSLRDALARRRPRHTHCPGVARPPRRQYHHDLHPRPEPRARRRPEPRRQYGPVSARGLQCPLDILGLSNSASGCYAVLASARYRTHSMVRWRRDGRVTLPPPATSAVLYGSSD